METSRSVKCRSGLNHLVLPVSSFDPVILSRLLLSGPLVAAGTCSLSFTRDFHGSFNSVWTNFICCPLHRNGGLRTWQFVQHWACWLGKLHQALLLLCDRLVLPEAEEP